MKQRNRRKASTRNPKAAARSRVLRSWARTIDEFHTSFVDAFAGIPQSSLMREIARHITPESSHDE